MSRAPSFISVACCLSALFLPSLAWSDGFPHPAQSEVYRSTTPIPPAPGVGGALYRLDLDHAAALHGYLAKGEFDQAVHEYFGTAYDDSIIRWVVHIDTNGVAHQGVAGKHTEGKHGMAHFHGNKEIWVMVFSEEPSTQTFVVSDTSLKHSISPGESALNSLISGYYTLLGKTNGPGTLPAAKAGAEDAKDSVNASTLAVSYPISASSSPMNFAIARVEFQENTMHRLALNPPTQDGEMTRAHLRRVYRTVVNGESSGLGAALVFGAAFNHVDQTRSNRDDAHPNLYLAAHWASIGSVRSPWAGEKTFCQKFGGFAGVSVRDEILTEFIAGLSWQVEGFVSLAAAATISKVNSTQAYGTRAHWEPRPFVGILYAL